MVTTKHTYLRAHAISGKVLQFALKTDAADLIERAQASKAGLAIWVARSAVVTA